MELQENWSNWFEKWKSLITKDNTILSRSANELSVQMKLINPKYILREWILVPAYESARVGDYTLVHELEEVMTNPYSEQSKVIEDKYYKLKPLEVFDVGGISHVSCSS